MMKTEVFLQEGTSIRNPGPLKPPLSRMLWRGHTSGQLGPQASPAGWMWLLALIPWLRLDLHGWNQLGFSVCGWLWLLILSGRGRRVWLWGGDGWWVELDAGILFYIALSKIICWPIGQSWCTQPAYSRTFLAASPAVSSRRFRTKASPWAWWCQR